MCLEQITFRENAYWKIHGRLRRKQDKKLFVMSGSVNSKHSWEEQREPHIPCKAKGISKTETQNSRAFTAARSYPQRTHCTGAMKQKRFKTNTMEENHAEKLLRYMQIKIRPFHIHLEYKCVLLLTHFKFIITAWWKVQGKAEKKKKKWNIIKNIRSPASRPASLAPWNPRCILNTYQIYTGKKQHSELLNRAAKF